MVFKCLLLLWTKYLEVHVYFSSCLRLLDVDLFCNSQTYIVIFTFVIKLILEVQDKSCAVSWYAIITEGFTQIHIYFTHFNWCERTDQKNQNAELQQLFFTAAQIVIFPGNELLILKHIWVTNLITFWIKLLATMNY